MMNRGCIAGRAIYTATSTVHVPCLEGLPESNNAQQGYMSCIIYNYTQTAKSYPQYARRFIIKRHGSQQYLLRTIVRIGASNAAIREYSCPQSCTGSPRFEIQDGALQWRTVCEKERTVARLISSGLSIPSFRIRALQCEEVTSV